MRYVMFGCRLMQGWLFVNERFWQPAQAKALLTSIPLVCHESFGLTSMIVSLDILTSEQRQQMRSGTFTHSG